MPPGIELLVWLTALARFHAACLAVLVRLALAGPPRREPVHPPWLGRFDERSARAGDAMRERVQRMGQRAERYQVEQQFAEVRTALLPRLLAEVHAGLRRPELAAERRGA